MGQKYSSQVKIEGHCDAKFLKVKEHFKEMISKGSDENIQLCVYVNGQCVIDLFGSINDDYNDNVKQIIFSSGKNIEAIVMAVLHDKGKYICFRVVMTVYFTTIFEGYHLKIKLLKKSRNFYFPAKCNN